MELWYIRTQYGAADLWHSYFVYRVQSKNGPHVRCFVEIRHLAESLCRQTQAEYTEMVDILCWLALERYVGAQGYREDRPHDGDTPDLGQKLLGAAAYLDNLPLVRQLLSDGHCPTVNNHIIPSPMQLAAWAGNVDMLKLLQEHLPDFENIPFEADSWRSKTGPGSIKGASTRGDMNILRLAIYPPSRVTPDSKDFAGYPFGRVDPYSQQGGDLRSALLCAKTPEIFQYIQRFFQDPGVDNRFLLVRYAELGNVDMVRYLLDAGVDINGGERLNCNPLSCAARYWHEDIVDLLLKRGADPNYQTVQQRGSPLRAAAMSGSMTIVRKLIDSGAKSIDNDWWPLFEAIRLEHTAMVRLLLDLNIGDAAARSQILKLALDLGLDSMVELLQQRGVSLPS
ncbi:ankyrin [Daldinia vernicosa]|uniref:ankyrin n=1 Tax=Daldinia vernicosa TaxID=114800 RepID=UPI0020073052|nr:ankyrin [Daldinia vernicosa]KAI0852430.1 ankyrin [Daldinia vernicosa]